MAWFLLLLAGIFEMGWPLGFKLADLHPRYFWPFILVAVLSMGLSGYLLYLAQKSIPISTAYIIWTGIGALGTFLAGIIWFDDSVSFLRMFFFLLILTGIIGLKVVH